MATLQLPLPLTTTEKFEPGQTRRKLITLLRRDLDFHSLASGYGSHNFHSFPARFPPQLPRLFIDGLTRRGDSVLDPMAGSGTTLVKTYLTGRQGLGFDIDPLALLVTKVKTTPLDPVQAAMHGQEVLARARAKVKHRCAQLAETPSESGM